MILARAPEWKMRENEVENSVANEVENKKPGGKRPAFPVLLRLQNVWEY
jgi:hypothetical protein